MEKKLAAAAAALGASYVGFQALDKKHAISNDVRLAKTLVRLRLKCVPVVENLNPAAAVLMSWLFRGRAGAPRLSLGCFVLDCAV